MLKPGAAYNTTYALISQKLWQIAHDLINEKVNVRQSRTEIVVSMHKTELSGTPGSTTRGDREGKCPGGLGSTKNIN